MEWSESVTTAAFLVTFVNSKAVFPGLLCVCVGGAGCPPFSGNHFLLSVSVGCDCEQCFV